MPTSSTSSQVIPSPCVPSGQEEQEKLPSRRERHSTPLKHGLDKHPSEKINLIIVLCYFEMELMFLLLKQKKIKSLLYSRLNYAEACDEWRGLAHGQHKTSQRFPTVNDSVSDLTGRGTKSQTSRADSDVITHYPHQVVLTTPTRWFPLRPPGVTTTPTRCYHYAHQVVTTTPTRW